MLRYKDVLPSVLEGLALYAHLINITFFNDLLNVLQKLTSTHSLTLQENLHCVYTAFQVSSNRYFSACLPFYLCLCQPLQSLVGIRFGRVRRKVAGRYHPQPRSRNRIGKNRRAVLGGNYFSACNPSVLDTVRNICL